jgi:hypothetical protein
MTRRRFALLSLVAVVSLGIAGCDREAKKQAELAKAEVSEIEGLVKAKHVDPLADALPKAADALAKEKDRGAAFAALRDKTDALRSAKRSYYAITDASGVITWVEDPDWRVVDRKLKVGFPAVADVLDGKKPYAAGAGRFGDEGPDALTFVEVAPIKVAGSIDGALVAAWDAHDASEDVQRQLATALKMQLATPKRRVKEADRLALALDTPQIWVAFFAQDGTVYMPWSTPQPVEDAVKGVGLAAKEPTGWTGTLKVSNAYWGIASKRIDGLFPGYGVAIVRNKS